MRLSLSTRILTELLGGRSRGSLRSGIIFSTCIVGVMLALWYASVSQSGRDRNWFVLTSALLSRSSPIVSTWKWLTASHSNLDNRFPNLIRSLRCGGEIVLSHMVPFQRLQPSKRIG